MLIALALVTGGCALLSWLLCRVAELVSPRIGFLDYPTPRKAHGRPVPFGGGTAVLCSVTAAVAGGWVAAWMALSVPGGSSWLVAEWADALPASLTAHLPGLLTKAPQAAGLLGVAWALHAVGLYDDAHGLGPVPKLAAQTAAAIVTVTVLDIRATFFVDWWPLTVTASAVWIVLIANAFNFLDNMDGLCAGVAIISGASLMAAALLNGEWFVAALLGSLVGSLGGFLARNAYPARLFLGDAGSQVVGYLIASVTLLATYYGGRGAPSADSPHGELAARGAIFIPLVALAVPLYDTASVVLIRFREGRPPWVADRRHFSHRLRARGLSVHQSVAAIWLCTLATSTGAVFLGRVPLAHAVLIVLQTLAVLAILAILESSAWAGAPDPQHQPPRVVGLPCDGPGPSGGG